MPGRFDGKSAIVTGGASGIGKEIARSLASEGANVLIVDRDEARASAVTAELQSRGNSAAYCVLDLAGEGDFAVVGQTAIKAFGSVDMLVNNAGIGAKCAALETTRAFWSHVMRTNLDSSFFCAQLAAREMIKGGRGGRIVNITSHSALLGSTDRAAYAASKGGLMALTRVLAVELAQYGITVNAVAPGPVSTPMSASHPPERISAWMNALPVQRYGTPSDIAAATLFLCSAEASYITGQTLCVDGGFTAKGIVMRDTWIPASATNAHR